MNLSKIIEDEKINTEFHLPGYNYCGPGTKVVTRILKGDKGINELDEACRIHDIEYLMYSGDDKMLSYSDSKLRERAINIGGISSTIVDNVFKLKQYLESLGLISPSGIAIKLARDLSINAQRKLGQFLYNNYIVNQ